MCLPRGAKMAVRQPGAGAQMLLDALLTRAGAAPGICAGLSRHVSPVPISPPRSAPARPTAGSRPAPRRKSAGLDFVPLLWENFDLLMRQRSYFRPSMQALIGFLGEKRLKQRAAELSGYDPAPAGLIRFAA